VLSPFEFWAVTACFAFPAAPGDDAIRLGPSGSPCVPARFGSGGFFAVRLAARDVTWLFGVPWFGAF
jgi:hypothetical protein